jgi:hypothetical protein
MLKNSKIKIKRKRVTLKKIICICSTGIWIQGLLLARQALNLLSHTLSPFYFNYFSARVSDLPRQLQTVILLPKGYCMTRNTDMHHYTGLIG